MSIFKKWFGRRKRDDYYNVPVQSPGLDDNYLIDFHVGFMGPDSPMIATGRVDSKPKKVKVKPKDVLDELGRIPSMWSLEHIDEKIDIMKDKVELLNQEYAQKELEDFISRLENRKKLHDKDKDKRTFLSYFQQFDTTTDEKVKVLTDKYSLVMKDADIFVPEFPIEAVEIMKLFTSKVKKVTGKKPIYYVIAEEGMFKEKYARRDPILLAQSPFGFYYHILGAWDTEMVYLPEL
jgi:effector-binding domain-containing protein